MLNDGRSAAAFARRIANRIGRPIGVNPFPRAFENELSVHKQSPKEVFDEIYRREYWLAIGTRSGVGSEFRFASRYRKRLEKLLHARGLRRFFDAPSGDLNWIGDLIKDENIEYSGGDISEEVVAGAVLRNPDVRLRLFDITTDMFPSADVWHCRDCLFHLPLESIRKALENFTSSSIPYALITSHRARVFHRNLDVGFGGFRLLDLERVPFSLTAPMARIPDYVLGRDFPRYVCLWSREQISNSLARKPT